MPRIRSRVLAILIVGLPLQTLVANAMDELNEPVEGPVWASIGLGTGSVNSLAPAPGAGRGTLGASLDVGYRFRPDWGIGMELGVLAPLSGCRELHCGESATEFAPSFNRLFAFGEYRPGNSGLRLRAGVGVSRFCYQRHWDEDAWSMFDTVMLLIDDQYLYYSDGSGAYRCDASRKALGGSISVGYDWHPGSEAPVSLGVRLSAEAANFDGKAGVGLPTFRHRAVTLSLHLTVN